MYLHCDFYRRRSLLIEFINSVPKTRLLRHKMTFINDIVHSPIFLHLGQSSGLVESFWVSYPCLPLVCIVLLYHSALIAAILSFCMSSVSCIFVLFLLWMPLKWVAATSNSQIYKRIEVVPYLIWVLGWSWPQCVGRNPAVVCSYIVPGLQWCFSSFKCHFSCLLYTSDAADE